jgi:hypothetical protein
MTASEEPPSVAALSLKNWRRVTCMTSSCGKSLTTEQGYRAAIVTLRAGFAYRTAAIVSETVISLCYFPSAVEIDVLSPLDDRKWPSTFKGGIIDIKLRTKIFYIS